MTGNLRLGVDIGGSHITAQLIEINTKQGIIESWTRDKVDTSATAEQIIDSWAKVIEMSLSFCKVNPNGIGIAMPGYMNYKMGICKIKGQGKYDALHGMDIKSLLANRLGYQKDKIHFMNDAASFLSGEMFAGSICGFREAIGLTLGTGLGTSHTENGIAKDSNLWRMPFKNGIAEDYISTRWFIKRFKELSGETIMDVKDLVYHYQQLPQFKALFDEFSQNLAAFLYLFIRKKCLLPL